MQAQLNLNLMLTAASLETSLGSTAATILGASWRDAPVPTRNRQAVVQAIVNIH